MRILAVFAHPDDEIGCIGTLAKHARRGDEVMLVWTTLGELASQFGDATHEEVTRVRREHGAWVAGKIGAQHHFFDMGDSRMTGSRAEALELARLYARFRPQAVITWSDDHPHPDHRMTAKIAFDAVTLARIPKIVNERAGGPMLPAPDLSGDPGMDSGEDQPRLEAWRDSVRFYQYHAAASPYPEIAVDTEDTIDVAAEVMAYYQAFYKWAWTPELYRQSRAEAGRLCGAKYAERFNLRVSHLPAQDYLR
ncbi:N-acetylglucosaminyl deacetylase, LmbE family [Deinococcus reticulitermitis]|uniref:N-acetylglucosaminyl deacetylase, LmbE family n=1 Tax=Deinococcus reticulitermitis TaxID=856736 RepID=A0A1H6VA77_9DEIO|nr:PIG-L deacetylase family protein [Deinococcus reticulitermitis]SEJ01458.1 N-acetylglucosaminyl deacetylase, LmbE family [Deinococcus reticulitermitis]